MAMRGLGCLLPWRRDEVLIYTALNDESCIEAISRLEQAGVRHRTALRGVFGGRADRWMHAGRQYDIYVPREQEERALRALQGRRGG
ncbi:hypothetical protein [Alicyclobacillus macrosporangiidus]|uniref:hypothetical protein n=1 Tax=Alicyclobacillus macrosporangiidus TaxID=392015 RepID=UPI0004968FB2|nr:hypothetical protein [Alicyclobacillus macrosporangiidus]